jgi:PAS domain S-box-containing protein
VIEDDVGDFGLIKAYVRRAGFLRDDDRPSVIWARTLAAGLEAARCDKPDLLLLDLSLPDSSEIETVKAMSAALPDTPIVVLTGTDDNDLAIAALEAGAQDYLIKGQFDHTALARAVRHALVRARLEARLRLFEVALNSAANGIVITDIEGKVHWANPAFTRITGFSAEDAVGRNPSDQTKSGKQDQAFYQHMWDTILSGQMWRGELVNRRKDGTLYDEALAIAPVVRGDGAIQHFVAIKQDITERKRTEQQLLDMAAGLEEQVRLRTLQLRTVSAQLTMTEERERRMLAQELHDNLGQLLAVVKIKLTSLEEGSPRSAIDQIVELVNQADRSARMITRQLSPPTLGVLGLVPALEWLADEIQRQYQLVVHIDIEREPDVLVEEIQAVLYRSVRELLINVARHAGINEASLSCLWDGSRLTLVVSDDGCGFDPAIGQNPLPGSHGFGLSSIYERITNIGGEMEIDSSPGNGTTITLTVPHSVAAKGRSSS